MVTVLYNILGHVIGFRTQSLSTNERDMGGGKWFASGGSFEPPKGGGGEGAPMTDLLLGPYLGFLSTPIWGPEAAGFM